MSPALLVRSADEWRARVLLGGRCRKDLSHGCHACRRKKVQSCCPGAERSSSPQRGICGTEVDADGNNKSVPKIQASVLTHVSTIS